MNHFELVEKLVNTFGVSYECAKKALEASDWDLTEAAVLVEREKNGVKAEATAAGNTRKCGADSRPRCEKPVMPKLIRDIWTFLSRNSVVINKNTSEVFLDIPIWLAILLICCFFWAVVILLVILLILGYRVNLRGPKGERFSVKWSTEKADDVEAVKNKAAEIKEKAEAIKAKAKAEAAEAKAAEAKVNAEPIIEVTAEKAVQTNEGDNGEQNTESADVKTETQE